MFSIQSSTQCTRFTLTGFDVKVNNANPDEVVVECMPKNIVVLEPSPEIKAKRQLAIGQLKAIEHEDSLDKVVAVFHQVASGLQGDPEGFKIALRSIHRLIACFTPLKEALEGSEMDMDKVGILGDAKKAAMNQMIEPFKAGAPLIKGYLKEYAQDEEQGITLGMMAMLMDTRSEEDRASFTLAAQLIRQAITHHLWIGLLGARSLEELEREVVLPWIKSIKSAEVLLVVKDALPLSAALKKVVWARVKSLLESVKDKDFEGFAEGVLKDEDCPRGLAQKLIESLLLKVSQAEDLGIGFGEEPLSSLMLLAEWSEATCDCLDERQGEVVIEALNKKPREFTDDFFIGFKAGNGMRGPSKLVRIYSMLAPNAKQVEAFKQRWRQLLEEYMAHLVKEIVDEHAPAYQRESNFKRLAYTCWEAERFNLGTVTVDIYAIPKEKWPEDLTKFSDPVRKILEPIFAEI